MKRVLNSGYVKFLNVEGSEQDLIERVKLFPFMDQLLLIYNSGLLEHVKFKFEIRSPLLCLQIFQSSNLGTLNTFVSSDASEVYLPPEFHSGGVQQGFHPMVDKHCNELNTKFSNFYRNVLNFYNKLLEQGVCQEQAKLVLPQGLFETFYWSLTAEELIEFIETNYNKSPELFGYCGVFVLYLEEHLPAITKWLKQNKWSDFKL